jgi:hypothetical protein
MGETGEAQLDATAMRVEGLNHESSTLPAV